MNTADMPSSTRVLAIDYGSERIGLALSDPLGMIATPFRTVRNAPGVLDQLAEVVRHEQVVTVVVGMPLNLKGEHAQKAQEVEAFILELEARLGMTVVRLDERFTTTIARQTMVTLGTKKSVRRDDRGRVDAMAAAVLLQGYLDRLKQSRSSS